MSCASCVCAHHSALEERDKIKHGHQVSTAVGFADEVWHIAIVRMMHQTDVPAGTVRFLKEAVAKEAIQNDPRKRIQLGRGIRQAQH